jgi:hypothetical protein
MPMSDAADAAGRPVPPDRATAIVRRVARAHGARHIAKQLGTIRPDRVARARARFARAMADDEVALLLVDTSFWRTGASGFLLTNRALYSSRLPGPVALEHVETARHRPPDHSMGPVEAVLMVLGCFIPLAHLLLLPLVLRRRDSRVHALLVNDRVVYAGTRNLAWAFWTDVLLALRAELDDAAGRLRVAVLEALPVNAPPLRAAAPPWEAIERTVRALDGAAIRAARLWAGEPGRSPGLEIVAADGGYALRELPTGWADDDPDVERVLEIARSFAEDGHLNDQFPPMTPNDRGRTKHQ